VGDLGRFVKGITDKPVTVLLTHGHLDHAFGAAWFDDVRMNPLEVPVIQAHRPLSAAVIEEARGEGRVTADAPDSTMFGPLTGGDVLDLGRLTVRVVDAAGHTPGSLAFLIAEERVLVTGDAANQFTFMFHDEAAGIAQYRESLGRLRADTQGLYDRILISHGTGDAPFFLLDELDVLCARILAREDDAVRFEFMGRCGLIARKAGGTEQVDDNANIVYNPQTLE